MRYEAKDINDSMHHDYFANNSYIINNYCDNLK